eukprot:scaffold43337_cov69-Phaeocystis_antarctica.AAC.6
MRSNQLARPAQVECRSRKPRLDIETLVPQLTREAHSHYVVSCGVEVGGIPFPFWIAMDVEHVEQPRAAMTPLDQRVPESRYSRDQQALASGRQHATPTNRRAYSSIARRKCEAAGGRRGVCPPSNLARCLAQTSCAQASQHHAAWQDGSTKPLRTRGRQFERCRWRLDSRCGRIDRPHHANDRHLRDVHPLGTPAQRGRHHFHCIDLLRRTDRAATLREARERVRYRHPRTRRKVVSLDLGTDRRACIATAQGEPNFCRYVATVVQLHAELCEIAVDKDQ